MVTTTEVTQEKRFYHYNGGITISFGKDKYVVAGGVREIDDAKLLRFRPVSNHGYGIYATSDPDEIRFLESRQDVLSEAQFLEESRTPEEKLHSTQNEVEELRRKLEEQNRLIQDLQSRRAMPGQPK